MSSWIRQVSEIRVKMDCSYKDLRVLCFMTPAMLLLRILLEKSCFLKIGTSLGLRNRRRETKHIEKLVDSSQDDKILERYSLQKPLKPSTRAKFCESSWRCLYYTTMFCYGLYVLWDKPWLWDINECWKAFPQRVTNDVKSYYFISMAFYSSSFINHFFDAKRKDFWQMLLHHISALILLVVSWSTGTYRVGSLVLVLHDCADIFLEAAKIFKYTSQKTVATTAFMMFVISWSVTRLWLLPFRIIRNTAIDARKTVHIPAYYVVNGFLILLQILHCYWTVLIYRVFYNFFIKNEMKDSRSDSETSDEEMKSD